MRQRALFVALAAATIAVGLLVHLGGMAIGRDVRDVLGDALWAAMIAWWTGALAPGWRLATRSATAYAVCVGVEVSQLYHTPALDAARATVLGHLVLGSGFDARDLAAYALGIGGAALLEAAVLARGRNPRGHLLSRIPWLAPRATGTTTADDADGAARRRGSR